MRSGKVSEVINQKVTEGAFNQDIEFVQAPGSFQFRLESIPAIGETSNNILKAFALNADEMLKTGHGVIA